MKRLFGIVLIIVAAMFVYAPVAIHRAPYESTMGLVQKIFYFHVPSWIVMFTAACTCGIASAIFIFAGRRNADRVGGSAGQGEGVFCRRGARTGPPVGPGAWG